MCAYDPSYRALHRPSENGAVEGDCVICARTVWVLLKLLDLLIGSIFCSCSVILFVICVFSFIYLI